MTVNNVHIPVEASAPPKRKGARKTPAQKTARGASGTVEILFKAEPQPHSPPVPPYIWIDYPQQHERLRAPEYVIRLGVGGAEAVDISVDKGPWQPCRLTSGYWWYDWKNIERGKHSLVARMKASGGPWYKTPTRNVEY